MRGGISRQRGWVRAVSATGFVLVLVLSAFAGLRTARADAPFSASTQVNDDAIDPIAPSRQNPSVAAFQGQIVVAAGENRNGSLDLYASRSADGGGTWADPESRVDADAGRAAQYGPALAAEPAGGLDAAWSDTRDGNGTTNIYSARSTDQGLTWSRPDVRVNSNTSSAWRGDPTITIDAPGSVSLAWEDLHVGGSDIVFARSTDGGRTWTDPNVRVNNDLHPDAYHPSLAVAGGRLFLAWAGRSAGSTSNALDLYVAWSLDSGTTWSAPVMAHDGRSGSVYGLSLAAAPAGDLILAWSDERTGFQQIYTSRSFDAGLTWWPGFRVRPTANVQMDPVVAVTSAGFEVAWVDNRGSRLWVYAANSTDGVAWRETLLGGSMGEIASPHLAVDGARTVAVWEDNPTGLDGPVEVHLARSDDGGLTWNPAVRIPDPAHDLADQDLPSIDVGPDGTVVAAWMDHRYAGDLIYDRDGDIFFSSSADGGQTWTRPSVRVSDPLVGAAESAPRLRRAPDGTLHLVWQNRTRHIVASRSPDGGSTWTRAVPIAPDPTLTDQISPDVTVNATGSLFVVFQGYQDPAWSAFLARSSDGGATWTTVLLPSGESRDAMVAADRQGNLYAGWMDAGFVGGLRVARSTDGGSTWSTPHVVTPGGVSYQGGGRLATDSDGTVYVVWSEMVTGYADIYFSRSTDLAVTWSTPVRLDRDTGLADHREPALAVGRQGAVVVAWTNLRIGDSDIHAVNSTDGGITWPSREWRVNDDILGSQLSSALATDHYGGIYAAWRDDRTGDANIRFARVAPLPNQAPHASFVIDPASGRYGTSFAVNASACTDLEDDASALLVRWDWEDDGVWDTSWTTVKTASHLFGAPGTYTVRLQVRDTVGATDTTTARVVVSPSPGETPPVDLSGLAPYVVVALAVAGALAAGIYLMRRRKRTGTPPATGGPPPGSSPP